MSNRIALLLFLLAAPALAQDVLVIAPAEYQPALAEWRKLREAQGLTVAVKEPGVDVRAVHKASGGKLRFVLLLGDVKQIPCGLERAQINQKWEKDPNIAHDNGYGDLDGDGVPELAVGRLPADTVEEAKTLLGKIVAYENDREFTTWRRRVNVVAGVGGFGTWQDWALETVATRFLTQNVPMSLDLHVTYANPNSVFCPPPDKVGATTLERFNEGALVFAYLGHGSPRSLDRLRFQGRSYDILNEEGAYALEARHGAPIALFVACSTGHVDGAPDCLAEVALKQPRGPVAVIASSRVSMPYGNGVLAKEFLDAMLTQRLPTIGEVVLQAKLRTIHPKEGDEGRAFIEALATPYAMLEWKADRRPEERREHVFLYNLFGDPSMRIALPAEATLQCAEEAAPGARLKVRGTSPVAGTATLELVGVRTTALPGRKGDDDAAFAETYQRANQRIRGTWATTVESGAFETHLPIPADLWPGDYFVRCFVQGEDGAAMASRPLAVKAPPEPSK